MKQFMNKISILLFMFFCNYTDLINCKAFSPFLKNISQKNCTTLQNNSMTIDDAKDDELLIYTPIKFTASGIRCFFKHKFNNPKYIEDVLPYSLSDLIQFLDYAKDSNQNRKFVKSIFKIFLQKTKYLEMISAKEFSRFLKEMPFLLKHYFIIPTNNINREGKVKDILYNEFLTKYKDFKEDPKNFFNNISKQICNSINEKLMPKDIEARELELIIVRFIECCTSKLAWPANEQNNIWIEFKKISQNVYDLKKEKIISDIDEVNDLINGLISRLTIIIDIAGSQIPIEVYNKAKEDIKSKKLPWLEIEEHDALITPKQTLLLLALINGEVKAKANQEYGLITEQVL